jgi:hypothetical protein
MNISVSDVSSRKMYGRDASDVSERGRLDVSTERWTSMTYIMSLTSGGRSPSSRVVVTE